MLLANCLCVNIFKGVCFLNTSRKPSKRILFSLALLLFTFSFATNILASGGHEGKQEQDTGPYNVILETEPETIVANEAATIKITVTKMADGEAVIGAEIINKATMEDSADSSGMSGMDDKDVGMDKPVETVMQEQSGMDMEPGTYMAEISFNEPGHWEQAISITSPLGQSTVEFPVSIANSGPNYVFIGIVAGLVVIAAIVAGIIKKKKITETGGTL